MPPAWSARPATPLVLLAGDRSRNRRQLGPALAARGFALCAMVVDAPAAVRAAVQYRPDACILDIDIPGHGVRALREIRARLPECAVVIVSRELDEQELFAALRAGAVGYLPSGMDPERLSHTLSRVLDGEVAIPRALVARLVDEFRDGLPQRRSLLLDEPTQLTSREWQVLDLLRDGHSTSEIAQRLVLSPVTVRTHINAIVHKLGYTGRDELLKDFSHA
jgi:DNA-binding NarL/FixJ family response regulator